jgi:hypothetical protein
MLHKSFSSISGRVLFLLTASTLLFSFSGIRGGDVFEVYLSDKKVIQQVVHTEPKAVKTFAIDRSSYNDKVKVMYSHCGQVGVSRVITITNENNKVLKTWKFADTDNSNKTVSCNAKDILDLVKENGNAKFNLVYSSKQLPEGKTLASMTVRNSSTEIGKLN